jgi:hypothetical protein
MKALHADLEALMPEPAFKLTWRGDLARYFVSKPNIGNTAVYTADQVREAMQAATERAAKLAATLAYDAAIKYANGREVDFEKEVGDAIRGDGRQV